MRFGVSGCAKVFGLRLNFRIPLLCEWREYGSGVMVSQYYYRRRELEGGPVPFGDLVMLAREGALNLEDVVRLEEDSQWRPAAEVPGLFHMAGRADEVSQWRAERRRKESGFKSQNAENDNSKKRRVEPGSVVTRERENEDSSGDRTGSSPIDELPENGIPGAELQDSEGEVSNLSREIKVATYAAAMQLRDRYGRPVESVAERRKSRLGIVFQELGARVIQSLKFLVSLPFVLLLVLWSRIGGNSTLPRWAEESLSVLFSRETVITAFRWGMTLAVPNLVAFGILSWSNVESQRYPSRDKMQIVSKTFPVWGEQLWRRWAVADRSSPVGSAGWSGWSKRGSPDCCANRGILRGSLPRSNNCWIIPPSGSSWGRQGETSF